MSTTRRVRVLLLVLALLAACADGHVEQADGFTVRDSAGVRIVEGGTLPHRDLAG